MPCCTDLSALPDANATLIAVRPPSTSDSYRDEPAAAAARWTGELGVWVEETAKLRVAKKDVDRVDVVFMTLATAAAVPLELGDLVTYKLGAGAEVTRRVQVLDPIEDVGVLTVTFWES